MLIVLFHGRTVIFGHSYSRCLLCYFMEGMLSSDTPMFIVLFQGRNVIFRHSYVHNDISWKDLYSGTPGVYCVISWKRYYLNHFLGLFVILHERSGTVP